MDQNPAASLPNSSDESPSLEQRRLFSLQLLETAREVKLQVDTALRSGDHAAAAVAYANQAAFSRRAQSSVSSATAQQLASAAYDRLTPQQHDAIPNEILLRLQLSRLEAALDAQDFDLARSLVRSIGPVCVNSSDADIRASILGLAAALAAQTNHATTAQLLWEQARRLHLNIGDLRSAGIDCLNLAGSAVSQGDWSTAAEEFETAISYFQTAGDVELLDRARGGWESTQKVLLLATFDVLLN